MCDLKTQVVYVFEAGPYSKVGISTREGVQHRVATCQTGCPERIVVVGVLACTTTTARQVEAVAHQVLHHANSWGEWFRIPGWMAFDYTAKVKQMMDRGALPEEWAPFVEMAAQNLKRYTRATSAKPVDLRTA